MKTQSENDRREIVWTECNGKILERYYVNELWIKKTKRMNLKSRMLQKKEERKSGY